MAIGNWLRALSRKRRGDEPSMASARWQPYNGGAASVGRRQRFAVSVSHERVIRFRNQSRAPRSVRRSLALGSLALLSAATLAASDAEGQAPPFDDAAAASTELAQARVAKPPGEAVRRLERLEWMIGQESWDEACDLADELLAERHDGWLPIEPQRYVSFREMVHRRLAVLPAEGLAAYRRRIDAVALDWLDRGVEGRDATHLRRVVDQAFCSTAGDDALWALGELELEHGNYQAARVAWLRIRPATTPAGALAYPDSPIELADVRARLALVSIRAEEFDRAEEELATIAREHPDGAGRLGGREVNYAQRLRELLAQARGWAARDSNSVADAEYREAWTREITPPPSAPPTNNATAGPPFCTTASGGLVFYHDGHGVHAVRLDTGENPLPNNRPLLADSGPLGYDPGLSMTANQHRLFITLPPAQPAERRRTNRDTPPLAAFDLARDGALLWRQRPTAEEAVFAGAPAVDGSRVAIVELNPTSGMAAAVACFDMWTTEPRWRQSLGAVQDSGVPEIGPQATVVSHDGVLYVNTGLGMIAALRVEDGEPLWLRTYDRRLDPRSAGERRGENRPTPCLVAGSTVIVTPRDSTEILALNAVTGALRWTQPMPAPDVQALAAVGGRVLLSGERLWTLSLANGDLLATGNDEPKRGAGQGAVVGDRLFWPTDRAIELIDLVTGNAGTPLPLAGHGGANLIVARDGDGTGEYLVAVGATHIIAYRRERAGDRGLSQGAYAPRSPAVLVPNSSEAIEE